ncbi:MAG TPA: phosphatidate cytidylyltransferase [Caulobacteraceae bacterium]|jgi:phosphatidate cytidylyltransferase
MSSIPESAASAEPSRSAPRSRRFDWKNLAVRAASAAVLAPLAVAAVWFGGWLFLVVLAVTVSLLAIEWAMMSSPGVSVRLSGAVTATILLALFAAYLGNYREAWMAVAGGAVLCGVAARALGERAEHGAFGVVYIAAPIVALAWLRDSPEGRGWTTLLFAVTWSADIGAFLIGSTLKGPKLWPRLSPNKTWSGAFGGLATAALASILITQVSNVRAPLWLAVTIGVAGGAATMAGDLWESMLKRRYGVKDSGDLIPGHGGLLDRVDGLIFAILAVAAIRLVLLKV